MDAGRRLMLAKGFPATTVDRICEAAGVTKGAFFHYFDGKEALGRAIVERFASDLFDTFRDGPFRQVADPRERVDAYVDFTIDVCREAILQDGCMLGLFAQELAETRPDIRDICERSFRGWGQDLEALLDQALSPRGARSVDTASLAEQFIAVVEGALILRKAYGDPQVVERALEQFRKYVRLLVAGPSGRGGKERR